MHDDSRTHTTVMDRQTYKLHNIRDASSMNLQRKSKNELQHQDTHYMYMYHKPNCLKQLLQLSATHKNIERHYY